MTVAAPAMSRRAKQSIHQREAVEDVERPAVRRTDELVLVVGPQPRAEDGAQRRCRAPHVGIPRGVLFVGVVPPFDAGPIMHRPGAGLERYPAPERGRLRPPGLLADDHDPERSAVDPEVEAPPLVAHGPFPEHVTGTTRPPAFLEVGTEEVAVVQKGPASLTGDLVRS